MTVATGFTKVELSGTGELPIEKTGTESLTISAEDNILPRLTSKVSGDALILGTKPNTTIVTTKPITYSFTVRTSRVSRCRCPAASAYPISRLLPSASRSAAQE
jgi:hypothetical protein